MSLASENIFLFYILQIAVLKFHLYLILLFVNFP